MRNKANYLDYIPRHNRLYPYSCNEAGHIEILVHNKGLFHGIARIFFGRPKYSTIELDPFGTYVWQCMDGTLTIYEIGKRLKKHFGEKAEPLYERLCLYLKTLHENGYIVYTKPA